MMKKIVIMGLVLLLTVCQGTYSKSNYSDLNPLKLKELSVNLLDLTKQEKQEAYQALDQYHQMDPPIPVDPKDQTSLDLLNGPQAYQNYKNQQSDQVYLLYLGFEDCPFCQAFVPKLNHLADRLELRIAYYNVMDHQEDADFDDLIDFLKISTVPALFLIKSDKIIGQVDHQSKMQEIEDLLQQVRAD